MSGRAGDALSSAREEATLRARKAEPAVVGDEPGAGIGYPSAVVILGGLVTSTASNLVVLPALVATFGRPAAVS